MARNRMIKPDFWDDEKMSQVSRDARLVFIALWNFSDDYGVVKGNHVWLKNHTFPYDDNLKLSEFESWINELVQEVRIVPFNSNNERYYFIKNFGKHQTINRPSAQRNPEPPDNILEGSRHTHDILTAEAKLKEVKLIKDQPKKVDFFQDKSNQYFNSIESSCLKILNLPIKNSNKPFNPCQFINRKINKDNCHPGAIDECLKQLINYWKTIESPWSYANNILKTSDGNWWEKENIRDHEKLKQDFNDFIADSLIKDLVQDIGEAVK